MGQRRSSEPQIVAAGYGIWFLFKDPATSTGLLRIVMYFANGNEILQSQEDNCQENTMAPWTGIADVDMITSFLDLLSPFPALLPSVAWETDRKGWIRANVPMESGRCPNKRTAFRLRGQFAHQCDPCPFPRLFHVRDDGSLWYKSSCPLQKL